MSQHTSSTPVDGPSDSSPPLANRLVHRAQRAHNLLVFLVVAAALLCLAGAQAKIVPFDALGVDPRAAWLMGLRLAIPVAMLGLTAMLTNRTVKAFVRRHGEARLTGDALAPVYCRCKRASMLLMTGAALFCDAFLLLRPPGLDVLVAAIPLVLLLMTRPLMSGLVGFAGLADSFRKDATRSDQPS